MSKYILNKTKNIIVDINPDEFANGSIVFPSKIDGNEIDSVSISKESLHKLGVLFKKFDVTIEDGIKNMSKHMFSHCNGIRSISIPPSIEYIPYCCFKSSSLQKIDFQTDSNLRIVAEFAFYCCSKLESISLPTSVTRIGEHAFQNSGLKNIIFSKNKDGINLGTLAFAECQRLEKVVFPKKMYVSLGTKVFSGCTTLKTVIMDKILADVIPIKAFFNCINLKNITLPETIIAIGEDAFYSCASLVTVGLKNTNVSRVVKSAFENCCNYSDGEFPKTIISIGTKAFCNCKLDSISLPATLEEVGYSAFAGNPFQKGLDLSFLIHCESIGGGVFAGCGVKSIHLPPLEGIGISANGLFEDCTELKDVYIEDNAVLSKNIFANCTSLQSVAFPNTLIHIPASAFSKCKSLKSVKFPASIVGIGDSAFYNTGLEEVDLSHCESINIHKNSFAVTNIKDIKLPVYNCSIYNNSFDKKIVDKLIKDYPFLTINNTSKKSVLPF